MAWSCDGQCCIETSPCPFRDRLYGSDMYVVVAPNSQVFGPFESEEAALEWKRNTIVTGYVRIVSKPH